MPKAWTIVRSASPAENEASALRLGTLFGRLRGHGLRLRTPSGADAVQVPAISGPGELGLRPGDVLVVATKSQDSVGVLSEWARQPVAKMQYCAVTVSHRLCHNPSQCPTVRGRVGVPRPTGG